MKKEKVSVRLYWFILFILCAVFCQCAANNSYHRGQYYFEKGNWEKAIEYFTLAAQEAPEDIKATIALDRAKVQQASTLAQLGQQALQEEQLEKAEHIFREALNLDPRNALAQDGIYFIRNIRKSKQLCFLANAEEKEQHWNKAAAYYQEALAIVPDSILAMEGLKRVNRCLIKEPDQKRREQWNQIVSFDFDNARLIDVLKALASVSGINILFDDVDVLQKNVSIQLDNIEIKSALDNLIKTYGLVIVQLESNTYLITLDTQENKAKYQQGEIRIFNLNYADVQDVEKTLNSILPSVKMIADERLNTILVSANSEEIDTISHLISALDTRQSEVLIEVEVLEIKRNAMKNLGMNLGVTPYIQLKMGGKVKGFDDYSPISIKDIENLSEGQLYLKVPSLYINLLKRDSHTRVLARPRLRIINRMPAKLHIGEKIPVKVTKSLFRDTSEETSTYEYKDVGILMELTPKILNALEMILDLHIEVSSIVSGIGSEQPTIGTRDIETTLRLRDGETTIIGGLIKDDERKRVTKIPVLGDIPGIGRMFSSVDKQVDQTDIIVSLTPHFMDKRSSQPFVQSFPSEAIVEKENNYYKKNSQNAKVSKRPLLNDKVSEETSKSDTSPGSPQNRELTVVFVEPSKITLLHDESKLLYVKIKHAGNVGSVPFYLEFNPHVMSIENIEEGEFLSRDDQPTAFMTSIDNKKGRAIIGLTRLNNTSGASGSGTLVKITILGKTAGRSSISFSHHSVRDPLAGTIRSQFLGGEIVVN